MFDFVAVPAIAVLCWLIGELVKIPMTEPSYKHIPVICATVGLVLGAVCYIAMPGYIPAENVIAAATIGVVSGLASTGADQIEKQVKK